MKNLFKRLFACCLAVCMVVTMCSVLFTVSAAQTGTVTVATVEASTTDAEVVVPVTIQAADSGLKAAQIWLGVSNLTIAKIELKGEELSKLEASYEADDAGVILDAFTPASTKAPKVYEGGQISILVESDEVIKTAIVIEITFAGTLTADTYDITVGEGTKAAYDKNADLIELTNTDGAIVVAPAHVCEAAETVRENEVAATCYAEGYYEEVVKCSCGKELSRTAKTIDKIAHTPAEAVVENNVAATCYAEGSYDSVVYCSVEACKAEIQREPVTVEKTEHTPAEAVVENNKAATCEADGSYDSVVYCSVAECKHEITRTPVVVDALGHTAGNTVVENEVATTCSADGSYDEVVYCSVCNEELSRETVIVKTLGHTYATPVIENEVAATADAEGSYESVIDCSKCGMELTRYVITVPKLPAVLDENIVPVAHSTSVGDTIGIGFKVELSSLPTAADYKLQVVRYTNGGKYKFAQNEPTVIDMAGKLTSTNALLFKTYYGMELYSLTVPITCVVQCYDASGNIIAYSNPFTTTLEEICETVINTDSTKAETKRVNADIIGVGAAAQAYFSDSNKTSDYATKLAIPSTDSEHLSTSMPTGISTYDSTSGIAIKPSPAVGESPYMNFTFTENFANVGKYRVEVSYYNKLTALKKPNEATVVVPFEPADLKGNASMIFGKFSSLPLYADDSEITFKLYQTGVAEPVGVRTYSLYTFIADYLAQPEEDTKPLTRTLYQEITELGYSMRVLKGIV